jgi:hypothetical protein
MGGALEQVRNSHSKLKLILTLLTAFQLTNAFGIDYAHQQRALSCHFEGKIGY